MSRAEGGPQLTKARALERNSRGVRSLHPNHTRVSQDSAFVNPVSSVPGALVKRQLLQQRIRQRSTCSRILTLLAVTVQHRVVIHPWAEAQARPHLLPLSVHPHHPLPVTAPCHMKRSCFQVRRHFVIHSGSQWDPLLCWLLCLNHFIIFFFYKNTVFSRSGFPNVPCEPRDGREDHQPFPHSHLSLLSQPQWPPHGQPPPMGPALHTRVSPACHMLRWVSCCIPQTRVKWQRGTARASLRFF